MSSCLALQAGQVGAGARFRVALRPAALAVDNGGNVLTLLRLVTVFQQGRAEHPQAYAIERGARPDFFHFLLDHLALAVAEASTAVFRGPLRGYPALVSHALEPGPRIFRWESAAASAPVLFLGRDGLALGRWAIVFQPLAYFLAELLEILQKRSPVGFAARMLGHAALLSDGRPW